MWGEDMKLTDKEALEDAVQGAINIMQSHGIDMMSASVPLAIIKGAPTIDAIPVEWLREFDLYYAGISGGTPYINALVEAWHRQQEAQDV